MSILSARNLSKAYGEQTLFARVALTVSPHERVGLLGANGAGKSTLLRILAGTEAPDEGIIDRRRDARILYLSQEPSLDPEKTPRQLVEEGLSEWYAAVQRYEAISRELLQRPGDPALFAEQSKAHEAIERLGGFEKGHVALQMLAHLGVTDVDRNVGTMSGGERRRVALARLLVAEPDLAILDEPTNHLDTATIEWLEAYLAEQFAGSVLMVTHDRYVLDAVAGRIVELDGGALTEFEGGYTDYVARKAELVEHAERVERNRQNLLRRERAWLLRGAKARSTKQKARLERARALVAGTGPAARKTADFGGLEQGATRSGKSILDFEGVTLDLSGKKLITELTLRLVSGDRIGIVGPNGAGKTSLLKLVTGELEPSSGKVNLGQNTKIVYFDQARSNLRDDWSVIENVAEREGADRSGGGGVVVIGDRSLDMALFLEQFLFDKAKQRQKVGALSGGERARVALAKALKAGSNLLLLDEPTNDLDVETLGAVEDLLESWPGSALVVSHDRAFLDTVATSILAFEGEGRVTRYPGGYETYWSLRQAAEQAQTESARFDQKPARPAPSAPPTSVQAGLKPLTYAERKELDGILDDIEKLEAAASALEAKLSDPSLYTQGHEAAEKIRADHARTTKELAERTARWEDLESRRELRRS